MFVYALTRINNLSLWCEIYIINTKSIFYEAVIFFAAEM